MEQELRKMLKYVGEDPDREGLKDTPKRIIKSWKELYSGYDQNPKDILTTFKNDGSDDVLYDDIVLLKNIPFYSTCEHHFLPFSGIAHIAYLPDREVIGISKLVRLLEVYSRRLQIQERIGSQVIGALNDYLKPKGAACILEASHLCMVCRGVKKQGSLMVTSSLSGVFKKDSKARQELMELIKL